MPQTAHRQFNVVSSILLIDQLTSGNNFVKINRMIKNAPLFTVFDEECNIMQRLSKLFCGQLFSEDLFGFDLMDLNI